MPRSVRPDSHFFLSAGTLFIRQESFIPGRKSVLVSHNHRFCLMQLFAVARRTLLSYDTKFKLI